MGYMGFGLRKEDYKRKPKRSFEKLKELYGNDTPKVKHNSDAPQLTTDEVLNKHRFRSIHDTKFFQIIKLVVIFSLIGLFINYSIIQPWFKERELAAYKQELVQSFNTDHDFILNSDDQLRSLVYFDIDSTESSFFAVAHGIKFNGAFSHGGSQVAKMGTWDTNAIDVSIDGNRLTVERQDSIQILEDKWIFVYKSDTTDKHYHKILEQLNIKPSYIAELRKRLKKVKIKKVTHEDSKVFIEIADTRQYGGYEYIRTHKEYEETTSFIKIRDLTYLRRKY